MRIVLLGSAVAFFGCAMDAPAPDCQDQGAPFAPTADIRAVALPARTVIPSDSKSVGAIPEDGRWRFVSPSYMYYPLDVKAGDRIAGFSWQVDKRTGPNEIVASIRRMSPIGETVVGSVSDEHYDQCGTLTIGTSQLDRVVADGETYVLRVAENAPDGSDTFGDATLLLHP